MTDIYSPPQSTITEQAPPVEKIPWLASAFWAWVFLSILAVVLSAMSGEYWDIMSQAVSLSGEIPAGVTHEQMVWGFIVFSLMFFAACILVGALLVWRTNKGSTWAKYLLTLFALFQLYLTGSSIISLSTEYTYTFGVDDWVLTPVTVLLLLYLGVRPYFRPKVSQ